MQRFALAVLLILAFAAPGHSERAAGAATSATPEPKANPGDPEKLVIVGDSTACIYGKTFASNGQPCYYRGWGQFLPYYLKENLEVVNLARPGRSTKTYMMEGSWKSALKEKPKFIFIQFGTNDAKGARTKEGVDAEIGYRMFIERYVEGAINDAAIPVLISPAHPRIFDHSTGKVIDTLGGYVDSMRSVATTKGIAMVDLYTASGEFYNKLGEKASAQFEPVRGDHVHFNALGAKAMTELVMRRLIKVEPRIQPYLVPDPETLKGAD